VERVLQEIKLMGELIPIDMLFGSDSIEFEFDFLRNGVRQAFFKYQTFEVNGIFTSNKAQNLQATVVTGPSTLDEIPTRVTDAVLQTVSDAPVTIPMPDQRVQLILNGILVWEWQVHFEAPVSTFRVDGTWALH
jgi:hypothetical protein